MLARTFALVLVLAAGCSTIPEGQRAARPASGPPEVRLAIVEEHARQFDEEEPGRPAGSQQELAASAYIVAHLTEAGYVSRLDAVPVQDLVRSTNVVALPPGGTEAEAIVVVPYDSTSTSLPGGHAIAVWLEVARALRVIEPDHSVEFVALGAEHTTIEGGRLGSRRLARQLADDELSPRIVVVEDVTAADAGVDVGGADAPGMIDEARALDVDAAEGPLGRGAGEVFDAAGFETTVVRGGASAVGPVLLAYLASL